MRTVETTSLRAVLATTVAVAAVVLAGCAPLPASAPAEAPAVANFVFAVPNSAPPVSPPMPIAILQPRTAGSLFFETLRAAPGAVPAASVAQRTRFQVAEMLNASKTDLERILIAKGFPSAGTFQTTDDMTFAQKERSSLILSPNMDVNVDVVGGGFGQAKMATVSGTVSLEFIEPMSREKVWVKRVQLPPHTVQIKADAPSFAEILAAGKQAPNPNAIGKVAMTQLLNDFYATAMSKIWDQLDPREIQGLKKDADKLKGRTNYRG
jgi:hypothetical protein